MDLQADIDRGTKAARLLADPMLKEAFQSVRQAIHEQWENSPLRDVEGQTALRSMLNHLRDLQAVLEVAVFDGKAAAEELERRTKNVLSPKQFFGSTR